MDTNFSKALGDSGQGSPNMPHSLGSQKELDMTLQVNNNNFGHSVRRRWVYHILVSYSKNLS